jgi:hypothetical protein
LESLNILGKSLQEISDATISRLQSKSSKPTPQTQASIPIVRVSTAKGRKHTLKKEAEQFKMVMAHSLYRKNPIGVLGEHLANTIKMQQNSVAQTKK